MFPNEYSLESSSISKNCKIFANRDDALELISENIRYLEIGVLAGDYSEEILNRKNPKFMHLLDTYDSDDWPDPNMYRKGDKRFYAMGHYEFVLNRFSHFSEAKLIVGDSMSTLSNITEIYDYIYIDARHEYDYVLNDLNASSKIISDNGIIGLNDYTMVDAKTLGRYGVVAATNEFLAKNTEFKVVGFAFGDNMFSDIYLQKTKA